MRKHIRNIGLTLLLLLAGGSPCRGQLTLEQCQTLARQNYPLIKQYGLIEKTRQYDLANASKGYLPQINVSAQASYQSDVTQIPLDLAQLGLGNVSIPTLSKDQYKAEVNISQPLWDGGQIRANRRLLDADADVQQHDIDVGLYAVEERIHHLFFGLLSVRQQVELNALLQEDLQRNLRKLDSYRQNGLANQSDLDILEVELLKARQQASALHHTEAAYRTVLSRFIGRTISPDEALEKPQPHEPQQMDIRRPELLKYDAQVRSYQARRSQLNSRLMPRLDLFLTGGYGKPGLDMLENSFEAYYRAGIRLSWNLGALYTRSNDRKRIDLGIRLVETQRETFLFNTRMEAVQGSSTVRSYREQLEYDDRIVHLRQSVKEATEKKVEQGTASADDLRQDILSLQQARVDRMLHETQLLLSIYQLKHITNQ